MAEPTTLTTRSEGSTPARAVATVPAERLEVEPRVLIDDAGENPRARRCADDVLL